MHLLEKQVVPLFSCLIENGDEQTRFYCSTAIAAMTLHDGMDTMYLRAGLMMALQALLGSSRLDTVCYALLRYVLSFTASVLFASDRTSICLDLSLLSGAWLLVLFPQHSEHRQLHEW
jgi:hypothetical protein